MHRIASSAIRSSLSGFVSQSLRQRLKSRLSGRLRSCSGSQLWIAAVLRPAQMSHIQQAREAVAHRLIGVRGDAVWRVGGTLWKIDMWQGNVIDGIRLVAANVDVPRRGQRGDARTTRGIPWRSGAEAIDDDQDGWDTVRHVAQPRQGWVENRIGMIPQIDPRLRGAYNAVE